MGREASGDGGIRKEASFARLCASIRLFRVAVVKTRGSSVVSAGAVTVMRPTRLANQTETNASPRPVTLSRPASSTATTESSVVLNLAQWVTSSTRSSE